jgi:tetratricopeptide (TPR) repeat protein
VALFEATLKLQESKLGPDHPDTLRTLANLGINYRDAGRLDEGIRRMEQALDRARARYGGLPPSLVFAEGQLAVAYDRAKRFDKSEPFCRNTLERARKLFGAADNRTAGAMTMLGMNLIQQRKEAEAEPILRECLAIRQKAQPDDWSTFNTRSVLGGSLLGQKKFAEAEPLILAGHEGMKAREAKIPAPAKSRLAEAAERVVRLYEEWGKTDQAAAWKAKLRMSDLPADIFARP